MDKFPQIILYTSLRKADTNLPGTFKIIISTTSIISNTTLGLNKKLYKDSKA